MISIAILAGGQSKRMGQDKALLKIGDWLVIERILANIQSLSDDIFISTNTPAQYKNFGLRIVEDIYPNKATLGGIYSVIR